jgi:hypothetical protein
MARKSTIFARAARRADMLLKKLSTKRGRVTTHLGSFSFTCPYCSKTLPSIDGRERHVTLQPYCRSRHIRELNGYISNHTKKKRRQRVLNDTVLNDTVDENAPSTSKRLRGDFEGEDEGTSSAKRIRSDDAGAAGCDHVEPPITEPPANLHGTGSTPESNMRPSRTESFPISTAGAPISSEIRGQTMTREDLRDYLASCGPMGEPDKFEVAELLMTTGLNGRNRTRYLKSCLVR